MAELAQDAYDEPETLNDVTAWLGRIFVALCAIAVLLLIGLLTR